MARPQWPKIPMRKPRPSYFFPLVILILTLPTAAMLTYVKVTGDQSLRPLGITLANLAENLTDGTSRGVIVQIDWGTLADSGSTKAQVKQALDKTLSAYAIEYRIKIRPTRGREIQVWFQVGNSRLGPYRLNNMSSGIPAALSAYRLVAADME
jgi:hypothetical protein